MSVTAIEPNFRSHLPALKTGVALLSAHGLPRLLVQQQNGDPQQLHLYHVWAMLEKYVVPRLEHLVTPAELVQFLVAPIPSKFLPTGGAAHEFSAAPVMVAAEEMAAAMVANEALAMVLSPNEHEQLQAFHAATQSFRPVLSEMAVVMPPQFALELGYIRHRDLQAKELLQDLKRTGAFLDTRTPFTAVEAQTSAYAMYAAAWHHVVGLFSFGINPRNLTDEDYAAQQRLLRICALGMRPDNPLDCHERERGQMQKLLVALRVAMPLTAEEPKPTEAEKLAFDALKKALGVRHEMSRYA